MSARLVPASFNLAAHGRVIGDAIAQRLEDASRSTAIKEVMQMPELTVYIVADRTFGERLPSLVERGPVWIISSEVNNAAAKRWWAAHPQALGLQRAPLTVFTVPENHLAEQWFLQTLKDVELHFGGSEGVAPLYDAIEVWGTEISSKIRIDVVNQGYVVVKEWPNGLRAMVDTQRSIAHA